MGHGTFVSGLISALDGNGRGGKGVAGTTKLIAIRASIDGSFTISDLVRGIEFSIRRRAAVINLSLAGDIAPFTQTQVRTLQAVFFNGALPVAAAGNNAENGNPLEFPAVLVGGHRGGPGLGLSVAATKPDGMRGGLLESQRLRQPRGARRQRGGLQVRRVLDATRQHHRMG